MKNKHILNYRKAYNLGGQDIVLCNICGQIANSLHHIVYKSQGGSDEVDNIIPLCMKHHNQAHFKKEPYITVEELMKIKLNQIT